MLKNSLAAIILLLVLSSCNQVQNTVQPAEVPTKTQVPTSSPAIPTETSTLPPTLTPTPKPSPTPTPTEHPGWLPEGAVLRYGKGAFYGMAASPDNTLLAIAAEGGIYMVDPLSGRIVDFLETNYTPWDVTFAPDGQQLYVGLGLGGTQVWIPGADGVWQVDRKIPEACGRFIKVSPDGKTLLSKCFSKRNQSFTAWDLTTDKQTFALAYQIKITNVFAMDFSPTDPTRAAFARGNILALIDLKNGRDIKTFTVPETKIITDIDFSPDGRTIAISPNTPEIILLDAETLEEKKRVTNSSEVRMLSFLNNEKFITVNNGQTILQDVYGKIDHILDYSGFPMHAVLPKLNSIALASGSVDIIDLVNFRTNNKINGFDGANWNSQNFSANGQAIIYGRSYGKNWDYYLGSLEKPDVSTSIDIKAVCNDATYVNFADQKGLYYRIQCPNAKKLAIVDTRSMRTVVSYDAPLSVTTNITPGQHPWKDDQDLSALVYKADSDKINEFRVDIRELVKEKLISSFTLENPTKDKPNIMGFSPSSKYVVALTSDRKKFFVFETITGSLVQTINVTLADTKKNDYPKFDIIKDESLFMIRKGKTAEIISIDTGKPVKKYFTLKDENFQYVEEIDRLINYSYRWGQNKEAVFTFDAYTVESEKVEKSYILKIPYGSDEKTENPDPSYSCQFDSKNMAPLFLQPVKDGLKALISLECSSNDKPGEYQNLKSFRTLIAKVDVISQTIESTYTYYPDFTWFHHLFMFGDQLYSLDDNFIFVWDTIPE